MQLRYYSNSEEMKMVPNFKCYSIVAIKDRIEIEEIK